MGLLDSPKINWLISRADKNLGSEEYRQALANYLKALKLKISIKDSSGYGQLYRKIGTCYMKMVGEFDIKKDTHLHKASEYFKKSAESFRDEGKHLDAGISYEFAANTHEILKEFDLAAEFDKLAAEMYSSANEIYQSSHAYNNSAKYYQDLGDYEKAAQSYIQAAELDLALKDYAKASKNYKSAGNCYRRIDDYEKAVEVYYTASGLDDKTGDYVSASNAHEIIARCQEKLGKSAEAIKEHERSYNIEIKEGLEDNATESLLNEGVDYQKVGDHDKAVEAFLRASSIAAAQGNNEFESRSLFGAALSQESQGLFIEAVENYLRSAEASTLASKREEAYDALKRAIDLSEKIASDFEGKGEYSKAADCWLNVAESHQNLHDEEKSAQAYNQRGVLLSKAGRADDSIESFKFAAERFIASKKFDDAAGSYIKAHEYQKAANLFTKNASDDLKEKKYFEAAQAYKTSSWCYARLKMKNKAKDLCNKYAWQYHTFITESEKAGTLDQAKKALALKNMGEANYRVGLLKRAPPLLEEALTIYEKIGDTREVALVSAEIALVSGLMLSGEAKWGEAMSKYEEVKEKLKGVDRSDFDEFYSEFVESLLARTDSAIQEIESKPDVVVAVDQPESLATSEEVALSAVISNKGVLPVREISFLPYCPNGIKSIGSPEKITELAAGESRRFEIKVEPTEVGEYSFKPLEILYQDNSGKKYMKASNEIKVQVALSHVEEKRQASEVMLEIIKRIEDKLESEFSSLSAGAIVLVSYEPGSYTQVYLSVLHYLSLTRNLNGVYVAVGNPAKSIINAAKDVGVDSSKLSFVDCISYLAGGSPENIENAVFVENPELLEEITMYLEKSLSNTSDPKFLVFDSISSMLVYNDSKSIEEFIHTVANKLRLEGTLGVILIARDESTKTIERTVTQFVDKHVSI